MRKNDRDYKVGDIIAINEYDLQKGYSGNHAIFVITYILDDPITCKLGYVVLGRSKCDIFNNLKLLEGEQNR